MKFTGRQLTIVVVSVAAAAVLTPTAVYAVTGSNMFITDPVSGSRARVFGGKVDVGDGSGALTVDGTVKVTDGSGALTVDGTVIPAQPSTAWSVNGAIDNSGSTTLTLADLPAGAGLTIGSIVLSHTTGTGSVQVVLHARHPNTAGNCAGGGVHQAYLGTYSVPADDTRTLTFAPFFRVPKQATESCVELFIIAGSPTQTVDATATGAKY